MQMAQYLPSIYNQNKHVKKIGIVLVNTSNAKSFVKLLQR